MQPSEAALKANDSFWKQQSSSAASDATSSLSVQLSASYKRRICLKRNKTLEIQ